MERERKKEKKPCACLGGSHPGSRNRLPGGSMPGVLQKWQGGHDGWGGGGWGGASKARRNRKQSQRGKRPGIRLSALLIQIGRK